MKKILLLLAILPMFLTSCSKEDESNEQTFFANVYTKYDNSSEEEIASNAIVYIFTNENKSIDNTESAMSVIDDGVITYTDGSTSSKPKYATKWQSGVFNIEKFPNGEYILWVACMNDFAAITYSSYNKISVNNNYRGTSEKKVFITSSGAGLYRFQNW